MRPRTVRSALLAAALLGAAAVPAGAATLALQAMPTLATGAGPVSPVIADLNGDGKVDIAVANSAATTISTFRGNGDGTFGGKADTFAGAFPNSLAVGAFRYPLILPDIVVGNFGTTSAQKGYSYLDNSAAAPGTFAKRGLPGESTVQVSGGLSGLIEFSLSPLPEVMAVGTAGGAGTLVQLQNLCRPEDVDVCAGTFGVSPTPSGGTYPSSGIPSPMSVVIGSFGSSAYDAAIADLSTSKVRFNRYDDAPGGPWFASTVSVDVGAQPFDLAAFDANGDGGTDIVTADFGAGTVTYLRRTGNLTFARATPVTGCSGARNIATGDLNRDGKGDFVVVCAFGGDARVMLGDGVAGFTAGPVLKAADGSPYQDVVLADVNGDRGLDVVLTSIAKDRVDVYRSTTGPAVASPPLPAGLSFDETDVLADSPELTVTFTTTASGDAFIAGAAITGTDAAQFVLVKNGCIGPTGAPIGVGPGQTCPLTVRFAPRQAGFAFANLEVEARGGAKLTVPLKGLAVLPGVVQITGLSLDERPVGAGVAFSVSRAANVTVTVEKRAAKRGGGFTYTPVAVRTEALAALNSADWTVGAVALKPATYRITVGAVDRAGRAAQLQKLLVVQIVRITDVGVTRGTKGARVTYSLTRGAKVTATLSRRVKRIGRKGFKYVPMASRSGTIKADVTIVWAVGKSKLGRGTYRVVIVAKDLTGGTRTVTKALTLS